MTNIIVFLSYLAVPFFWLSLLHVLAFPQLYTSTQFNIDKWALAAGVPCWEGFDGFCHLYPTFPQRSSAFLTWGMTPGEGGYITQLQDAQIILHMQHCLLAIFPIYFLFKKNWLVHPYLMHILHFGTCPSPFHMAVACITEWAWAYGQWPASVQWWHTLPSVWGFSLGSWLIFWLGVGSGKLWRRDPFASTAGGRNTAL